MSRGKLLNNLIEMVSYSCLTPSTLSAYSGADPDLYEARAIVLGNLGEHRQALDIYVFKLKDSEKAEEYVFHTVIKLEY